MKMKDRMKRVKVWMIWIVVQPSLKLVLYQVVKNHFTFFFKKNK